MVRWVSCQRTVRVFNPSTQHSSQLFVSHYTALPCITSFIRLIRSLSLSLSPVRNRLQWKWSPLVTERKHTHRIAKPLSLQPRVHWSATCVCGSVALWHRRSGRPFFLTCAMVCLALAASEPSSRRTLSYLFRRCVSRSGCLTCFSFVLCAYVCVCLCVCVCMCVVRRSNNIQSLCQTSMAIGQ